MTQPALVPTTLALGPVYAQLAKVCARAFAFYTGVPLRVVELPAGADPYREKLALLERFPGERILYLDADVIALRPWSLDYADGLWLAVEQSRAPHGMWNTGVWIAGPEHAAVFADALSHYDAGLRGPPRQDEPALTAALEAAGVMPKVLSPFVNHQRWMPLDNTIAIHLLGGTPREKLMRARALTSSLPPCPPLRVIPADVGPDEVVEEECGPLVAVASVATSKSKTKRK